MKVLQLVDSVEYARANCWQHQIIEALSSRCDLTVAPLATFHLHEPASYDVVLSTLKLRTLVRELPRLERWLGGRPIVVYDQDPWEAFIDSGSLKGAYATIDDRLTVSRFLNTSEHWCRLINDSLGKEKSRLIRMWMLPRYCSEGLPWSQRPIDVGFMGTLHPYRRRFFDALGINVHIEPPRDYAAFLAFLSRTRFFIHNEDDATWSIDGQHITKNCCWAKEIEIASQGCFAVRQWEPECDAYYVGQIPSVKTFSSVDDIPALLAAVRADPASDEAARAGVSFVRSRPAWNDLLRELEATRRL